MPTLSQGQKLVVASHNPGKVWEIRKLIAPYGLDAVSAGDLALPEPAETETTFTGNARIKALSAARGSGLPALADDSGLEVACLGGAPGVFSADWAGPKRDFGLAMNKVAEEITARHGWSHPGPRANFITVLCLGWPCGTTVEFTGRIHGVLVWPPRGANGFGYDAMFLPDGEDATFGEMDPARKNAISHRAQAFAAFERECLAAAGINPSANGGQGAVPSARDGLAAAAASISTREEFVRFIAALRADVGAGDAVSLENYLDRLGAWATLAAIKDEPIWRTFARALVAARTAS